MYGGEWLYVQLGTRRFHYALAFKKVAATLSVMLVCAHLGFEGSIPALPFSSGQVGCFGDSHTEGLHGAPWVASLQRQLGRVCINYGKNAWTVESVLRSAESATPVQDATILVGTNNVLMELALRRSNQAMLSLYRALNLLPLDYEPGIERYSASLRQLLKTVPASGRITVASLPPLAGREASDLIAAYNEEIYAVVNEYPSAIYVPFGERLESLREHERDAFDASYVGFSKTISQMYYHTALRWSPNGPSFDDLAAKQRRSVLHDNIHLTEASVSVLLDLLSQALSNEDS